MMNNSNTVLKRDFDFGRSNFRTYNRKKNFVIDFSEYKEISIESPIRKDIKDVYTDFVIEDAPRKSIVGKRFVKGQAMSFFKELVSFIDNQNLKSDQDGTYINFAYGWAREIIDAGVDTKNIVEVESGVCIPTAEFYSENGDALKGELEGEWILKFSVTEEVVKFRVSSADSITLAPEGAIAMTPLYDDEEQADLIEDSIGAIIDMGQGSNDITPVKYGEAQGFNARSFPYGGISLESSVASVLERDGKGSSIGVVKSAIEKGYVMDGKAKVAVGKSVAGCKERLANKTKESVISVLAEDFMQASEIKYIFPIGRNFKTTDADENKEFSTGSLATMIKNVWPSEIETLTLKPLGDDFKCVDRTQPMKDGKYPEVKADIEELANVYGLGYALADEDEDEDYSADSTTEHAELHLA